jgi:pimeloyl-ACP methyl ester carboxylesterase
MKLLAMLFVAALSAGTHPAAADDSSNVKVSGSGEPVVFIPGLLGSEYGYRNVIADLDPARYRSIVIEPLGFGSSQRPEESDYSITAQADRIAAVLDTLVDRPVWLVAHSVGASIAYRIAYRHPRHVRGILSLEGGPTETLATKGFRIAMKFAPLFRILGPSAMLEMIREEMTRASADAGWITEQLILAYTVGFRRDYGASLNALKAMSRAEEPERLADHLGEIQCPVLLLLGAAPHRSRPSSDDVALLVERIPQMAIDSVPGAGHFIHEEDPKAVVAAIERLVQMSRTTAG